MLIDPRFIQFAVLLAVIAGILELLPIIGPIISMVPTLLVALTTSDPVLAVDRRGRAVPGRPAGRRRRARAQDPGSAVELHPALIIFVLIVGGSIAGLLGAILAIPITAAARDVYRYLFRRLSDSPPPEVAPQSDLSAEPMVDAPELHADVEPSAEPTPEG